MSCEVQRQRGHIGSGAATDADEKGEQEWRVRIRRSRESNTAGPARGAMVAWTLGQSTSGTAKAESLYDVWLAMADASVAVAQHGCGLAGGATRGSGERKASDRGGGLDSRSTML